MPSFDDVFNAIKGGVADLAKQTLSNYKDAAISDANQFLEDSKGDLKRWADQLANGTLTAKDVEWLMKGRMDLAQLVGLKQAGLAAAQLDKFKNGVFGVVIKSLTGVL